MTIILQLETPFQRIPLGPFVDENDGFTPETGLTINNTDIKLWKNFGTSLVNKNSGGATHMANGVYLCTLDDVDTDTVGPLVIFVNVAGARPVRVECEVVGASTWSAWVAGNPFMAFVDEFSSSARSDMREDFESTLEFYNLTRLLKMPVDPDLPTTVHADSVIGHMLHSGDNAYSRATDSMQIVAGDIANMLTGLGEIRVKKNTALNNFMFVMRQSVDHVTPATGLSVTAQRSIDGGAFGNCSNPVSEVGNGVYKINLSAGDLNGDVITLKFTAAGADQRTITLVTQNPV